MAYVITSKCRDEKDASCVQVCPVDCIHPADDEDGFAAAKQLYIDPESCIDCDACMAACPVEAIYPADRVPADLIDSIEENAAFYRESA